MVWEGINSLHVSALNVLVFQFQCQCQLLLVCSCQDHQWGVYFMDSNDLSIMNWNVRGLNDAAHRETVKQMINCARPSIVCLQETKLSQISTGHALETLG